MAQRLVYADGYSDDATLAHLIATDMRSAEGQLALNLSSRRRPRLRVCGGQLTSTEHTDCMLVVHPEVDVRKKLTRSLERLGYDVIAVATSLRAVWALEHEPERIRAAMVSDRLMLTDGSELLCFMARRYPDVKRVLVPTESRTYPANDIHPEVDRVALDIEHGVSQLLADLFHEDF